LIRTTDGVIFSSASQHFLVGPDLNLHSGDHYIAFWARVDDVSALAYIIAETDFSSDTGWYIGELTSSELEFGVFDDFVANDRDVVSVSVLNTNVYFVEAYYDQSTGQRGIAASLSTGSLQSFSTKTRTILAPSVSLTIGNRSGNTSSGNQANARISEIAIANQLPADLTTSSAFRNALFNSGSPLTYEDLTPS
jgi:hypothetical protein